MPEPPGLLAASAAAVLPAVVAGLAAPGAVMALVAGWALWLAAAAATTVAWGAYGDATAGTSGR